MALKECPTCRTMIRASSTRCRCGHAFDPMSIVKQVTRRCPLCGLAEDGAAASCACGYDFSSPASDVRRQLERRRTFAWIWLATGVLAVLGATALLFFVSLLLGIVVTAGSAWLIARGLSALSWTRGELAEVKARERALPQARVVE